MAVRRPVALFSPIATLCVATAVACLWATTVSCSTSGSNRKAVANGVVEKWEVFNPKPKEVILALADGSAVASGMLELWVNALHRTQTNNYVIGALDKETAAICQQRAWKYHEISLEDAPIPKSENRRKGEVVSSRKYAVVAKILEQGISVLVSDLDIAILRNPFHNLVRDSDIEGASDGWLLEKWAGSSSVSYMKSTALLSGSYSIAQINAGWFYIKPTAAAKNLMYVLAKYLRDNRGWDQLVFNEALFSPIGSLASLGLTMRPKLRVADPSRFTGSRTFLRYYEELATFLNWETKSRGLYFPDAIHVNYHCAKREHLQAIYNAFFEGNVTDLQIMFEDQYYGGQVSLKDPEAPKLKCPKSSNKGDWLDSEDQDNKIEQIISPNKSYIGKVHSIVTKNAP